MSDERATPSPAATPPPRVPRGMAVMLRVGFAIGGLLLLIALVLTIRETLFIAHGTSSSATVSRIDREWMSSSNSYRNNSGGNWGYRVVASFVADGRTIEVRSPSVVSSTRYRVGDTIAVEYPSGRPDQAQLARFVDRWMLELVIGTIGAAFVAICGFAVWLTRLPGAQITSGGFGFVVGSPVYSVDADMREPSSRPPSSTWKKTAWLVAAVLVAGIAIGIVIARSSDHRPRFPSVAGVAAGNDIGAASPTRGYPSPLTVKAPPMTDDQSVSLTSWTDLQNGGTAAQNLTMAARAFLARPDQDAAMQSALRTKAARLGLDCPGTVFQPGDTKLLHKPPPLFDTDGTMRQGLIRQRFAVLGCPAPTPPFNIWIYAAGDGSPVKTVPGYPGTTRADPQLILDATPTVLGIAARLAPGCRSLAVIDTHLVAPEPTDGTTPWTEDWLVSGCGKRIALTVRFVPDRARGGTRIEVPDTLAHVVSQ